MSAVRMMWKSHAGRVGRDRWRVDELDLDVLERHHSRERLGRRERVGRDLGVEPGQLLDQRGLAAVGRADDRDLARALLLDVEPVGPLGPALAKEPPSPS